MLLCPPRTQISPTRTLVRTMLRFSPLTESSCGLALADYAGNVTFQRRSASAFVFACWPAKETVTCSPGVAQPQTLIGLSR